jgi:two-component system, OmpR family, sensor histidine kinase KdpD
MSVFSRVLRAGLSLSAVGIVVAVCLLIPHVRTAAAVLVLLLTILAIASGWGFWEAVIATGTAMALLAYFFLPPAGWAVESIENWLVFFTFLAVALLASHFTARAKRQAKEAVGRQTEVERLYALGQALRSKGSSGFVVADCLDFLVSIFQVEAAAFYDVNSGEITLAGSQANVISKNLLRDALIRSDLLRETKTGAYYLPLICGNQVIGSLAIHGGDVKEITFRTIADRITMRVEEVLAYQKLRAAEEARRNQELKTALLDSLTHEIKTPISAIKTAASSLLSTDSDAASRRELLSIIDEEADRLDASVSEVFWTTRVEAGTLQSGKGPHDLRPLVDETLRELRSLLGGTPVTLESPDPLPLANCDFYMVKGVLKELVTNALKYSPVGSPLMISLQRAGDEIITSVADSGMGIQAGEENRIFEKHYRGSARGTGAGLGLAIAKTIVEAHGGRIRAENRPGTGSVVQFSLPISHREAA